MKFTLYLIMLIAIAFQGFAQQNSIEPIVKTGSSGVIRLVEFPQEMDSKNVPSTSDRFFHDFLGVRHADEFRLEPQDVKPNGLAIE